MWRLVVVLVAACNQVYALDPTKQRDAPVLADRDGDGVGDAEDNCADRPNATQSDADGDLRGDACDECPLLRRTSADGDGDGVGDACDPQPTLPHECLALVETFSDTAGFAEHWMTETSDGASTITVVDGKAAFVPAMTSSTLTITERSTAGMHGSVMVIGRTLDSRPSVLAIAGKEPTGFYGCRLQGDVIAAEGFGASVGFLSPLVPDRSVGDRFLIRLDTISGTPVTVLCRVDYGASVAAQARDSQAGSGPAGVRVNAVPAEVDAIAFVTSRATSGPCQTEYR